MTRVALAVAIDLGGTHVAAAVVDRRGRLLGRSQRAIDRQQGEVDLLQGDVAAAVRAALADAGARFEAVQGVGIGVPGRVDAAGRRCLLAPNLGWRDTPVAELLEQILSTPVRVINDVNAQALGEMARGAARGVRNFALVSVGTGIGGALVIDGHLLDGAHGVGGEIGHVTVDPRGPLCGCGNRGCVETLAAGPAIARAGREALSRGLAPGIRRHTVDAASVDARAVGLAALEGDAQAKRILQVAGRWLGVAVASLVSLVDPELVLVCGGVASCGAPVLDPLRSEVARRCRLTAVDSDRIRPAALGADAGLVGAGIWVLRAPPCRISSGQAAR